MSLYRKSLPHGGVFFFSVDPTVNRFRKGSEGSWASVYLSLVSSAHICFILGEGKTGSGNGVGWWAELVLSSS